jgi:hypothetical protein
MKTVLIHRSYVRISAIESVTLIPKEKEHHEAIVAICTRQMHYNMAFKTDEEANAYLKTIVDLMNE